MSIATSHSSPLISLPAKATDEVDLAAAVRVLIHNTYGQNPKDFSEQLTALNRARQDAVRGGGSEPTTRDLLYKWFHMLEMLELRFPELRVPFPWKDAFTAKSISQQSLAYEKASIIFNIGAVLSSIAARASRLGGASSSASASAGNVPSSAAGASQAATPSSDGLKLSYASFRQAAGMLSYINDNFLHAPSTDMSKDVVRWLVTLMLAQANEVLWEKTVEEKKSHSLAARLAMQCSVMYKQLDKDAKEWVQKGIFERTWMLLAQTKAKHFASVAQYYRALADSANSNHGSCLVRLTVAETLAKEATRLAHVFSSHTLSGSYSSSWALSDDSPPLFPRPTSPTSPSESGPKSTIPSDAGTSMAGIVAAHQSIVSERKAVAVKDNDLIYHDILPSESALAAIEPMSAATPISIQDIYAGPEVQKLLGVPVARGGARNSGASGLASNDLFSKLVPLGVHESASMYSEEKAKLARAESEKCDLADGELQASLDYMGLPAALSRFKGVGLNGGLGANAIDSLVDPGAEVRGWADEEEGSDAGGIDASLSRIENTHRQALADLDEAKRLLDEDNMQCEKMRVRFGAAWEQEPGAKATKALRGDIKAHKEAALQAASNNERIRASWEAVRGDYSILVAGRDRLEGAFAEAIAGSQRSNGGGGGGLLDLSEEQEQASEADAARLSALSSTIETLLSTLNKLKRDRAECLTDLKARIQSDDISNLLVLHRRSPPEALQGIFGQELEKFRGHQARIHKGLAEQAKLLAELAKAWKEVKENGAGRKIEQEYASKSKARKALVDRLRRAKEDGKDLRVMLAKANAFYGELGNLVEQSRNEARSFSRERGEERERLRQKAEWDEKGRDGGSYESSSASRYESPPSSRYESPGAGRYASPPPPPGGQGLDAAFGSMSLGGRGGGPPPPPVPRAPSGSYGGSYTSPPPAPSSSGYGSFPPPPPQPRAPVTSPYDALGAFESSYGGGQASRPSYAAPPPPPGGSSVYSGGAPTSYERGPAAQPHGQWTGQQQPSRTPSLPPPPPQPSYLSNSNPGPYGAPSPQSPYSSLQQQQQQQQQQPSYGHPPPPPQQQYAYQQSQAQGYGQPPPPPPPQQGYGQPAQSPYGAPPPPPQHGQYGSNQWQSRGY